MTGDEHKSKYYGLPEDTLRKCIVQINKKSIYYSKLPIDKKPPWDKRHYKEIEKLRANPIFEFEIELLRKISAFKGKDIDVFKDIWGTTPKNYINEVLKKMKNNLGISLRTSKMISSYCFTGDYWSKSYYHDIPVKIAIHLYGVILPSLTPESDYSLYTKKVDPLEWGKNYFSIICGIGATREDINFFMRNFFPEVRTLTNTGFSTPKKIKLPNSEKSEIYKKIVVERFQGKTMLSIATDNDIDVKTVFNIIKKSNVDGPMGDLLEKQLIIEGPKYIEYINQLKLQ